MWNWIKTQLNYRNKYLASLETNKEAYKNALLVLGQHEALTASLPLEHELSTQVYWKDYADKNLMQENENLRGTIKHLRESNSKMTIEWMDGIMRYGVQMYGKWQPIEIAPKDKPILVYGDASEGNLGEFGQRIAVAKYHSELSLFSGDRPMFVYAPSRGEEGGSDRCICPSHWMPLPEEPK
jgi:hypothetical protein